MNITASAFINDDETLHHPYNLSNAFFIHKLV